MGRTAVRRWAIPQEPTPATTAYEDHRTFGHQYGVQRPRGGLIYSLADLSPGTCSLPAPRRGSTSRKRDQLGPNGLVHRRHRRPPRACAAYDAAPAEYLDPTTSTRYRLLGGHVARLGSGHRGLSTPIAHGSTTYQTDIPQIVAGSRDPGGASAPAFAIALLRIRLASCASAGIAPARRPTTSTGFGPDGAIQWRQILGGLVLQNAIAANPDRRDVRGGRQANADWYSSGGAWAELLELDAATGEIAAPST